MKSVNECRKILGVDSTATPEELKRAYRDLVREWHPDRFLHNPRLQSNAQEKLREINEAYSQLQAVILDQKTPRKNLSDKSGSSRVTNDRRRPNNPRLQRMAGKFTSNSLDASWPRSLSSAWRAIFLAARDPWVIAALIFMLVVAVIADWFY